MGQICFAEEHAVKPHRARGMVVMRVGEHHLHRQIRQRAHKGLHVFKAVAGIDEQGFARAGEQRHAHAHGVLNMVNAGQHFVCVKNTHMRVSFRME